MITWHVCTICRLALCMFYEQSVKLASKTLDSFIFLLKFMMKCHCDLENRHLETVQWAVSQLLNDCAMRLILKPQLYQTATSWGKLKISQGEVIETTASPSALWLLHQSVGNIIIITSLSQIHPDSSYVLLYVNENLLRSFPCI